MDSQAQEKALYIWGGAICDTDLPERKAVQELCQRSVGTAA
jgi:hypothetical protein